jgi:hypothetical protein
VNILDQPIFQDRTNSEKNAPMWKLILMVGLLACPKCYAQEQSDLDSLNAKIDTLEVVKMDLERRLDSISRRIDMLKQKSLELRTVIEGQVGFVVILTEDAPFPTAPKGPDEYHPIGTEVTVYRFGKHSSTRQ